MRLDHLLSKREEVGVGCIIQLSRTVKSLRWRCGQGTHPFPSRTRWLRPDRPMVLYWRRYGRAGGCRFTSFCGDTEACTLKTAYREKDIKYPMPGKPRGLPSKRNHFKERVSKSQGDLTKGAPCNAMHGVRRNQAKKGAGRMPWH